LLKESGKLVAVKRIWINPHHVQMGDDKQLQAVIQEIQTIKRLQHPNVVQYLGAFRDDDMLHIVMEFLAHGSVESLILRYGALPEQTVAKYTADLCLGLQYLHAHNIAHRDIKGANTLLTAQGTVKLADFGSSKLVGSYTDTLSGTPNFMAPEVAHGLKYDPFRVTFGALGRACSR